MDKIRDLSLPNFSKPAIRPSGVIGTQPVFPDAPPLPYSAVSEDIEPAYTHVRPLTADMPKKRRKVAAEKPTPKPKTPRKSKTLRVYETALAPTSGHYTDARGKPLSACHCGHTFTGAEDVDRFEYALLTCIVCPDCRWGHIITKGTGWKAGEVSHE